MSIETEGPVIEEIKDQKEEMPVIQRPAKTPEDDDDFDEVTFAKNNIIHAS